MYTQLLKDIKLLTGELKRARLLEEFPDPTKEDVFMLCSLTMQQANIFYQALSFPKKFDRLQKRIGDKEYRKMVSAFIFNNLEVIRRLEQMATIDPLTGLYNRFAFEVLLNRNANAALRDPKLELSAVMLDIDYFKSINDTYGHQKGDEVLKGVTGIIKETLGFETTPNVKSEAKELLLSVIKESDLELILEGCSLLEGQPIYSTINRKVVSEVIRNQLREKVSCRNIDNLLREYTTKAIIKGFATVFDKPSPGRFGGEEILVVFPYTSLEEAIERAEEIRKKVERKYKGQLKRKRKKKGKIIKGITISGGVQSLREYLELRKHLIYQGLATNLPEDIDARIKELGSQLTLGTDLALYGAKKHGRNAIWSFRKTIEHTRRADKEFSDQIGLERKALPKFLAVAREYYRN
jgi:GGDEF domain-containing protein